MIRVSNGNKKIGNDTLIINMCSATDCPSREKGLCRVSDKCYAMKAEKQYPSVLPYRREQQSYWEGTSSEDIAKDLRDIIKRKHNKIKYIRFSEAGDFQSQEDVDKLFDAGRSLQEVRWYGYTAREDLNFTEIPDNVVVNGSGFMVSNSFTAVQDISERDIECPGNCRECNLCKASNGLDIKVRYH